MKNKNIECLIENVNENYEIDVQTWSDRAKSLFRILLESDEISKNSCLVDYDEEFENIFFDITFTNSSDTHELNRTYRDKDYAADIITFAIFADSEDEIIIDKRIVLGDIVIALDKVEAMAEEEGKTFEWELKFLIAHGILHLLGFDHQSEEEYNFVVRHQNRAIKELDSDKV